MITKPDFATFAFSLAKAVPTFAPDFKDQETIDIWFKAFQHVSMDELRRIFVFARDNEKHFPSIARLKELMKTTEASKFDHLVYLIGAHGAYRPPVTDELMARTINRLGGWQRVCEWETEELPFRRKDFDSAYSELSAQAQMGQLPPGPPTQLAGIHENSKAKSELAIVPGGRAS